MLSKAQLATIAANLLDAATHFRVIAALGPLFLDGAGDALKTKANGTANGEKNSPPAAGPEPPGRGPHARPEHALDRPPHP
jgi:hypothetical protein